METNKKNGGDESLPLVAMSEPSLYPRVIWCYSVTHPTMYDMSILCADCARDVAETWELKDLEAKGLGLGYSGRANGEFMTIEPLWVAENVTARACPRCSPTRWVEECERVTGVRFK